MKRFVWKRTKAFAESRESSATELREKKKLGLPVSPYHFLCRILVTFSLVWFAKTTRYKTRVCVWSIAYDHDHYDFSKSLLVFRNVENYWYSAFRRKINRFVVNIFFLFLYVPDLAWLCSFQAKLHVNNQIIVAAP